MYLKKEDVLKSKMTNDELKLQLNNLKKGDYLDLSNWFGGKNEGGNYGYLVNFDDKKIYCFSAIGLYRDQFETHALLKEVYNISETERNDIIKIINDEKLLEHDIQDKLVMDAGSTIDISLKGKKSITINAEFKYTNGQINSFNLLNEYIENLLNKEGSIFTEIKDLNVDELKKLRKEKIYLCIDKTNYQNLNDLEVKNSGYLFFNCKMIIENIRLIDSKLINKFQNQLSENEQVFYKNELSFLDEHKSKYNGMEDVKEILTKMSND